MRASDHGIPPRTAEVTVTISISQDQNLPTFNKTQYQAEIPQEMSEGSTVLQVLAFDKDVSKTFWFIILLLFQENLVYVCAVGHRYCI